MFLVSLYFRLVGKSYFRTADTSDSREPPFYEFFRSFQTPLDAGVRLVRRKA